MTLKLQKVLYKKIDSFFAIDEALNLTVQNTSFLNVNYSEKCTSCYASLVTETLAPERPDLFHINIELIGIFQCEGIQTDADKQAAHVQIYHYLFPYAQGTVADLSGKAGLSPLMLEMSELDPGAVTLSE